MKSYRLSTLLKMCLVVISCFALITSCEKEDKVNTDQLVGGEVTLKTFGPCPIQRGAELRIMGTNLDKVESVVLQGCGAVADIKRISNIEIRITVPQNAEPGLIVLKAGNKEITSITGLTFNEPILINSITPLSIKPGGVIKIEGDYLNLIKEIIFVDDVHVLQAGFISQSREAIELVVPREAQTGKVVVSDGADLVTPEEAEEGIEPGIPLWVYSDDELVVVLPTLTAFSPGTIRAGSELTITGKDFDLVKTVSFGGDKTAESFTVNGEKTTITVIVPKDAQDGPVVLTAFSDVKVTGESELIMVVPTISAIAPNPVKNGAVLTITGTNLDLIDKVTFGGAKDGKIVEGGTATEIKVEVPKDAKDGKVIFTTLAKKEVESADLAMVKPKVTAYNPSPAPAGADVKLQGENLDLVVSVTFGGDLVVPVAPDAANELIVNIPITAVSGVVVLTTVNGDKINCPELTIISPTFAFLVNLPDPDAEIHAGELLTVEVGNGNKLTEVKINGMSVKYILEGTKLYILIPGSAAGKCELKLISSNGEAAYTIPVIAAGLVENVIWEGLWTLQWGACLEIDKNLLQDVPVGARMRVYLTVTRAGSADLGFITANWAEKIPTGHEWSKSDNVLGVPEGTAYLEIVITPEFRQAMQAGMNTWNNTWVMLQGDGAIISKVSIVTGSEIPKTVLWTGSVGPIGWSGGDLVGPIDADLLTPGKAIGIDFAVDSGGGQMEVMAGSWWTGLEGWVAMNNGDRYIRNCDASETNIEFVLTQTDINNIKQQGSKLLICGNGVTIKRVYIY